MRARGASRNAEVVGDVHRAWVSVRHAATLSLRPASATRGGVQAEAHQASHPSRRGEPGPVRGVIERRWRSDAFRRPRVGRRLAGPARTGAGAFRILREASVRDNRNDRGGHISSEPRINDRIRVPEVRLVGPEGEQAGEADLDLVEVAPMARPPVCKLMDYGKFKYESAQKAREARRNQTLTVIKEMKLRPKIDSHDYLTKKGHVERFLKQGDKVKVTIMFRGREQSRPELGFRLLQRLADDIQELGFVESSPKQDGRNMIMVVAPHRTVKPVKHGGPTADSGTE